MKRTAIISPCGNYRYNLSRTWDETLPRLAWLMLNPSTADGTTDDATIRKCIGFAKTWGYGGIDVINLFALRSTDPKGLLTTQDPIGPDYQLHFDAVIDRCQELVIAWGCGGTLKAHPPLERRAKYYLQHCKTLLIPVYCFGFTKDGQPRHPLMLGYATERVLFA